MATGVMVPAYPFVIPGLGKILMRAQPEYIMLLVPEETINRPHRVWIPPSAGRPPSPAIPAQPPTPAQEYSAAWDGGASSIEFVTGDVELSFIASPSAVGIVCGLATQREGDGYESIEFALYISHGKVRPIELGVFATTSMQSIHPSDRLSIALQQGVVTYSVNGSPFHVSASMELGTVFARAELFSAGDFVRDAALQSLSVPHKISVNLCPLESVSGNKTYASSKGVLPQLVTAAIGLGKCSSYSSMSPLTGIATNKQYAQSSAELPALTGKSKPKGIVPTYCLSAVELAPINGVSLGTTGGIISSSGSIRGLTGKSSDRPYAESMAELPPLIGDSSDVRPRRGYFFKSLGGKFTLDAYGVALDGNAATISAPSATLRAFAGAIGAAISQPSVLSIGGEIQVVGGANLLTAPVELTATGAVTELGVVRIKGIRASIAAFGGGTLSVTAPNAVIAGQASEPIMGRAMLFPRSATVASGFSGAVLTQRLFGTAALSTNASTAIVGTAQVESPPPSVKASGSRFTFGAASLVMPLPQLAASLNRAALTMPDPVLAATGGIALEPWGEAWVFGLGDSTDAQGAPVATRYPASRYTQFPFLQILYFDGHHYGVGADGVYRLGGNTDNGLPIAWDVETHISDFKSPQLKSMASAFIGAHLGPAAGVKAVVGEVSSYAYIYPNVRGAPIQNHRVVFGRGMRSRYYGVRIEDESGGDLHMDSIDLEVVNLSRKI